MFGIIFYLLLPAFAQALCGEPKCPNGQCYSQGSIDIEGVHDCTSVQLYYWTDGSCMKQCVYTDCEGSWGTWSSCLCSGKQLKTYTVVTQESWGGSVCESSNGETKSKDCSPPSTCYTTQTPTTPSDNELYSYSKGYQSATIEFETVEPDNFVDAGCIYECLKDLSITVTESGSVTIDSQDPPNSCICPQASGSMISDTKASCEIFGLPFELTCTTGYNVEISVTVGSNLDPPIEGISEGNIIAQYKVVSGGPLFESNFFDYFLTWPWPLGGIIGGAVVLVIILVTVCCVCCHRQRKKNIFIVSSTKHTEHIPRVVTSIL